VSAEHNRHSEANPTHQVRAVYDSRTIRVYQAYSHEIADSALARGTFVSPPYKLDRMTWIKPSFLWMMYRSGWGLKDTGQARILALDIAREGFDWALAHGSHTRQETSSPGAPPTEQKSAVPVLIQWDPERDLQLRPQEHRSIQIGLRGHAIRLYVTEWIRSITDVTDLARQIQARVAAKDLDEAARMLPQERPYESWIDGSLATWPGRSHH
jgi:hypothetical protein